MTLELSSVATSPVGPINIDNVDEGAGTFTITLVFNETMNTAVSPIISFPEMSNNPGALLTFTAGTFSAGNTTYTATFSLNDGVVLDLTDIDISVANATSSAGEVLPTVTVPDVFSVDTELATPTAPDLTAASDVGSGGSANNDDITNNTSPTFDIAVPATGLEVGDVISLIDTSNGDAVLATHTITLGDLGDTIQLTSSALADGTHGIEVQFSDAAGNSTSSSTLSVEIDTTAPVPMITLDANIAGDDTINITEEAGMVAIAGTVAGDFSDGDTVTLTIGGATVGMGTVDSGGAFSIDVAGSALAGGTSITASVTTTDAAGNPATASISEGYSVDTTAPVPTIALDANITDDDTISIADAAGNVAITGTVGGEFSVGDTVTLTIDGASVGTGTVDALGAFSIDVAGSALAGASTTSITASVTTTDAAGNSATVTTSEGYSVDTTAPEAPTIQLSSDSLVGAQNDATPTISGTGEIGATVTLSIGIGEMLPTFISIAVTDDGEGNGVWSFTPEIPLVSEEGEVTLSFSAVQTDVAGNTSPSTSETLELDFAPEIIGFVDNGNEDDGANNGVGTAVELADDPAGETGTVTATGDILFEDIPSGQTHTVGVTPPSGVPLVGIFSAGVSDAADTDTTGIVTWNFAVDNAAVDYLGAEDSLSFDYTVTLSDNNGDAVSQIITVVIQGTNDAPVITVDMGDSISADLTESNAGLTSDGTLSVEDIDVSDEVT
ncbi:MAG: Ig-like domain-containing protein, partial [Tateyamaria sp.]